MNAVLAITDPAMKLSCRLPITLTMMAIAMAGCGPSWYPPTRIINCNRMRLPSDYPEKKAVVTVSPNNPTGAVYPQKHNSGE
jgi:aspartate/methionine/tyrosine aminotransferase